MDFDIKDRFRWSWSFFNAGKEDTVTDERLQNSLPADVLRDAKILWDYHHLPPGDEAAYRDTSKDPEGVNASSAAVVPADGPGGPHAAGAEEAPAAPYAAILAFGSHDRRVARRAAALFLTAAATGAASEIAPGAATDASRKAAPETAPLLILTGGRGRLTERAFSGSEAALFRQEALRLGVPEDVIYIEEKSSNTGENIAFTKEMLRQKGLLASVQAGRVLVVDKPARERRTWAALKKQWPELAFQITSPRGTFAECLAYYRTGAEGAGLSVEDYLQLLVDDLRRLEAYPDRGFQIPVPIPPEVQDAGARLAAHLARQRSALPQEKMGSQWHL